MSGFNFREPYKFISSENGPFPLHPIFQIPTHALAHVGLHDWSALRFFYLLRAVRANLALPLQVFSEPLHSSRICFCFSRALVRSHAVFSPARTFVFHDFRRFLQLWRLLKFYNSMCWLEINQALDRDFVLKVRWLDYSAKLGRFQQSVFWYAEKTVIDCHFFDLRSKFFWILSVLLILLVLLVNFVLFVLMLRHNPSLELFDLRVEIYQDWFELWFMTHTCVNAPFEGKWAPWALTHIFRELGCFLRAEVFLRLRNSHMYIRWGALFKVLFQ